MNPHLQFSEVTPTPPSDARVQQLSRPVGPSQQASLGWPAFYRPKGSNGFPITSPVALNTAAAETNAPVGIQAFAAAARPRHIGSYTDAEPRGMHETAKALQAIAKSLTSKDEAVGQDRGKVSSIGKAEERMAFILRGCDSFTVPVCQATVGKELYQVRSSSSLKEVAEGRSLG